MKTIVRFAPLHLTMDKTYCLFRMYIFIHSRNHGIDDRESVMLCTRGPVNKEILFHIYLFICEKSSEALVKTLSEKP